ncbi:MAG TPA: ATP-binding cassette domain-containing protein [Ottowia sp.]|nr:ATP-binding cassette domain-containing protein [Ottowia sp.]
MIAPVESPPRATGALALDTYELTKRFGSFTALDHVTMRVEPGSVHALLGENGAGKSTLVKCVAGFQVAEEGSILIDGREQDVANPVVARHLGIGMVYQHFTLAPGMTVAENLLLAGGKTPAVIDWKAQRAELKQFLATTPFTLDLDARPAELAAGEKQKLELLKQLYLKPRLLILDEPTSVLTPQEADEVLGHVREFARSGLCTVLIITHKFREVMGYADAVTVHSNANRNVLIASGADPAKLSVIPNWVDAEKYERARGRPVPLADPTIIEGKFVALFAGVMGYAQDFQVVIDAAKALKGDPDVLFLLVGDGPRGAWVRREAALLPNVIVHPFIQGEEYPALLAAADCGLVTLEKSMKTPVVPSKILGYMAAGKPVVGSLNRESEAVAIIEDAGCGFARGVETGEDLAERISRLRRDPELAREMGAAGRECVRRSFSPRACLDAYFELARSLRRPQ